MIKIIKHNGQIESFNGEKIRRAIRKSAARVCIEIPEKDENKLINSIKNKLKAQLVDISVNTIHNMVETELDNINQPRVAKSYREYRDSKSIFSEMLDKVYSKKLSLAFVGDRSNANADSALVTTQKAIVYNELNSELYKKFFLSQKEEKAVSDGYIYIHDRGSRLDTMNCCLFDMKNLITGGFFMGNLDYMEPKSLDVAFDLIGDVTLNAASSQYGGFTISQVDKLFAPYAEKSYRMYYDEYMKIARSQHEDWEEVEEDESSMCRIESGADEYATNKVRREFEQGFQSWEMKFNSVASSRGDYPFTAITFGLGTGKFESMCSSVAMKVRAGGQGKPGFKHPVLFPKLSFFYDENLHGKGKELEWLFDEAIHCSMKTMYPDFISLTGDGYAPSIYKKYGVPISRMGCVVGSSKITVRINGDILNNITFEDFWNSMASKYKVRKQGELGYSKPGFFIDLPSEVEILDKNGVFVKCPRVIKNIHDTEWMKVVLDDSKELVCTFDHPWTLTVRDNVRADKLKVGDEVFVTSGNNSVKTSRIAYLVSLKGQCFEDSYDVTTESSHFVVNGIYSHNCRANLSPWYIRGGMEPADENDVPVYEGRFNMGAISLNFSMIGAKAKKEDKDYFEILDYYLEMVRGIHKKTFEFLSHKKAGINPLGFCQGGFYGGNKNPDEEVGEDLLRPMTMSFGIIGLNEASVLWTGKRIDEDNSWAISVLQHINEYVNRIKKEDNILYAIYGTPGESLVATQVTQFRKKYGIVNGVSDRDYVTNSFHCPVYADITPIQKQDIEYPMFHLCNGGNIAYARMRSNYNFDAFKDLTTRAMKKGFYWGNNQSLDFCEKCGFSFTDLQLCPKCGSEDITRIERMNGYLSYASVRGKTMYSDTKLQEFKDRVSM